MKDYVTLSGTVTATLAILFALLGVFYADSFWILVATFFWAGAMICDLLDGWVARKLNQVNEIGKEIDSLSDAVSFVVTPGVIILSAGLNGEFVTTILPAETLIIGILIFVFCGILRLAWFNVEDTGEGYTGLVTPMSAAFIILLFVTHYHFNRLAAGWTEYYSLLQPIGNFFGNILVVIIIMIILGALNLAPFLRYSGNMQKKRGNWIIYLLILGVILTVMVILASIFSGLNPDIAILIGHTFPLSFLLCVLAYIIHGFIHYLALKRKGEL